MSRKSSEIHVHLLKTWVLQTTSEESLSWIAYFITELSHEFNEKRDVKVSLNMRYLLDITLDTIKS